MDLGKKEGMKRGLGKEGRNEKRTLGKKDGRKEDFRKKERRNEGTKEVLL